MRFGHCQGAFARSIILAVRQEDTASVIVRGELLAVIGPLKIELLQFDVDCGSKPFRVIPVRQRPPNGLPLKAGDSTVSEVNRFDDALWKLVFVWVLAEEVENGPRDNSLSHSTAGIIHAWNNVEAMESVLW